jgi:hypothetical protein
MGDLVNDYANPIGLGFTLLMGCVMLVLPRKYALIPVVILICYMTMGTGVIIAGFNFTMLRLLLVFTWLRIIVRGEFGRIQMNPIDKSLIAFVISALVIYTVLWQTYDALKYKLGLVYNVVGFYFAFRMLIRDREDVVRVLKFFAFLIAPLACLILEERATGHNWFAFLGGVPELTMIRDGTLRCEGPFRQPILTGTFGATVMSYFAALWLLRSRVLALMGIISSLIIVFLAASSGPVLAGLGGVLALAMWRMRGHLKWIRRAGVTVFLGLAAFMNAPVWYLIARMDVVNGSTGWHRAFLLDMATKHFSEWWLLGVKSTRSWADYDQIWDITNQYISYGVDGGLITMILFVLIIAFAFRAVGRFVNSENESRADRLLLWCLGAALLAHTVNYFSITYFDQNFVVWYMLLAMISTLAGGYLLTPAPLTAAEEPSNAVLESAETAEKWINPEVAAL